MVGPIALRILLGRGLGDSVDVRLREIEFQRSVVDVVMIPIVGTKSIVDIGVLGQINEGHL